MIPPSKATEAGSGTGAAEKFKSPVVVPAVVRVIAAPIVSENGVTVGMNVPVVDPE